MCAGVRRRRAARSASTASVVVRYSSAGPIAEIPARHAQQAVVREVGQERRPRFDGVERVFAQHEGAGRGRRPGVDERDLDGAEPIARSRDEAARFVVDEPDAGVAIEMAGEVAEPSLTVRMMFLLMSTAVTDRAPKASADSTSRPPPAPITSTSRSGRR